LTFLSFSGQVDDVDVDIDLPTGDSSKKIPFENGSIIMLDSILKRYGIK
jgi:hypothetical protein